MKTKQQKILVTGATGLVGSNLTRKLVEQGQSVRILARKNSTNPLIQNLKIERIEGDITDFESVKKAVLGCDIVYHMAAKISFNKNEWPELNKINVLGTRNVLNASLECGVKKVIHGSSCAVIGAPSTNKELMTEETEFPSSEKKPGYPYSKWIAEQEVFEAVNKGLDVSIANFSTIYGKGEKILNTGRIIKSIHQLPIFVAPPGSCSVIAVDDAISGIIQMAKIGKNGERYILTGENLTYLQVFDTIAQVVKNSRIRIAMPRIARLPAMMSANILEKISSILGQPSKLLTVDVIKNLFYHRQLDNTKAIKELNWLPKTDFKTAVKDAFEFYKKENL